MIACEVLFMSINTTKLSKVPSTASETEPGVAKVPISIFRNLAERRPPCRYCMEAPIGRSYDYGSGWFDTCRLTPAGSREFIVSGWHEQRKQTQFQLMPFQLVQGCD